MIIKGYTKGARNEIFAARPAPIQLALMGFAGTMGCGRVYDPDHMQHGDKPYENNISALSDLSFFEDLRQRWIDYMVVDELAVPRHHVCGEPIGSMDDSNRVYTEGMIYLPDTYFVNDHKQGFRELPNNEIETIMNQLELREKTFTHNYSENSLFYGNNRVWRSEQLRRLIMRREMFPHVPEDYVIFANFNQLYKLDPKIFKVWMQILKRIPKSILWLLRFPPSGETYLRQTAIELVGERVASRLLFTGFFYLIFRCCP